MLSTISRNTRSCHDIVLTQIDNVCITTYYWTVHVTVFELLMPLYVSSNKLSLESVDVSFDVLSPSFLDDFLDVALLMRWLWFDFSLVIVALACCSSSSN